MTKRATTGKRENAPEVPAIDLDFKTAVTRLLQVKPEQTRRKRTPEQIDKKASPTKGPKATP